MLHIKEIYLSLRHIEPVFPFCGIRIISDVWKIGMYIRAGLLEIAVIWPTFRKTPTFLGCVGPLLTVRSSSADCWMPIRGGDFQYSRLGSLLANSTMSRTRMCSVRR